jgi:transglutaminase-like putative cysteine protease
VNEYLQPTWFLDSDSPAVQRFAADAIRDAEEPRQRATRLFSAVRDDIRYDPYAVSADPELYRASTTAQARSAFCIPKAVLLAAASRAVGIPARLGFADVRNHFSSTRLHALLGTDLFVFHGYAELLLDGRWLKATPAFNRELCARFGVAPLGFDGTADALFQPFDSAGRRHMEYVRDRGTTSDLPLPEILRVFRETYPNLSLDRWRQAGSDPAFESQAADAQGRAVHDSRSSGAR